MGLPVEAKHASDIEPILDGPTVGLGVGVELSCNCSEFTVVECGLRLQRLLDVSNVSRYVVPPNGVPSGFSAPGKGAAIVAGEADFNEYGYGCR